MRSFLYATLNLIKHGEKETCEELEKNVRNGVATYLSAKYKEYFTEIPQYKIDEADNYFRDQEAEFADSDRSYDCRGDEGLYLLISIALNKLN